MRLYSFERLVQQYPTYNEAVKHMNKGKFITEDRLLICPHDIDIVCEHQIDIIKDKIKDYDVDEGLCNVFSKCSDCWRAGLLFAYSTKQQKLE